MKEDLKEATDLIMEAAGVVIDSTVRDTIVNFAKSLAVGDQVLSEGDRITAVEHLARYRGFRIRDLYGEALDLHFNAEVFHDKKRWRVYDADADAEVPDGLRLILARQIMFLKKGVLVADVEKC